MQQYPPIFVVTLKSQVSLTIKIMKSLLYTRGGDSGSTSLVGGQRVRKNSARLEAYGTIDELSSTLGLAAAQPGCPAEISGQIRMIQNELFNIGSYLATATVAGETPRCTSVTPEKMTQLEGWIDTLDEQSPKINAFVLPGGCQASAAMHTARVVCRRAERRILDLADTEYVDPAVTGYINRLSDYLFIAARYENFINGVDEITWQKD